MKNYQWVKRVITLSFAVLYLVSAGGGGAAVLEEVTVTAKKREQSIYDVPVAISAFTGDTIEKQGILDLVDVGKFVPNLNVTTFSAGNTSSANPFIRGIGLQDHLITTDPGVSVYVDGVYLGRQVGQNWALANIERLEVLRGPQGTLYGRNSIGGAINIITRKPGEETGGRVSLQSGTRGRLNADFFADVKLSDNWAASIAGGLKRRDGVGEFLLLDNPGVEVGELQDINFRFALQWAPSDSLTFLLAADGNEGENGLNPYTTLIDEVPGGAVYTEGYRNSDLAANIYDSNTGQQDLATTSNQAWGLALTTELALGENWDAKLVLSHRRSDYEGGLDDDSLFEDFLSFPEIGYADQTSIELQLNADLGSFYFVSGFYYFEEEGDNSQIPVTFNGDAGGTFFLEQETTSYALYANLGYELTDGLTLSGGLRYTDDEKDANTDINSSMLKTSASRDWDEISWDLALSWELGEQLTVYGSIASGYQSGAFPARPYCLFGDFFGAGGGEAIPADNCFVAGDNITALNYEVGIKGQLASNFEMSIALFNTEYKKLPYQVSATSDDGFSTTNVIVDQTSRGVEWESRWFLTDGFSINTSFGYIDAEVDAPNAEAPLTPEMTASISPQYTAFLDSGAELSFRVDWSYRDDMFGEPSNTPGRFTGIESRDLINFDISYEASDSSWTAAIYGRNVTDERYDNARLNTGDYVLRILSNDASEFGVRFAISY